MKKSTKICIGCATLLALGAAIMASVPRLTKAHASSAQQTHVIKKEYTD